MRRRARDLRVAACSRAGWRRRPPCRRGRLPPSASGRRCCRRRGRRARRPSRCPKCSRIVSRSASAWQGWCVVGERVDDGHARRRPRARSTSDCANVRIDDGVARSRESTRAVSAIGSPRPSCSSSGRSIIGQHPEPLRGRLERDARPRRRLARRSRPAPCRPARRASRAGRAFIAAARSSSRLSSLGVQVARRGAGARRRGGGDHSDSLLDRAGHAARAAAAAAELGAGDRDDLDALAPEPRVRVDVALVGDDDAGRDREDVVAVVPLLALGLVLVAAGLEQAQRGHVERAARSRRRGRPRAQRRPRSARRRLKPTSSSRISG